MAQKKSYRLRFNGGMELKDSCSRERLVALPVAPVMFEPLTYALKQYGGGDNLTPYVYN